MIFQIIVWIHIGITLSFFIELGIVTIIVHVPKFIVAAAKDAAKTTLNYAAPLYCTPHSHSIVLSYRNALT
ncbi:hypothetical protein SAMN05444161_6478 [Rhizobiales bacterium GAS191]|nr:hypothetical protein SAMN05444161_6478 [Rhizobiales bacterium GAS191]